MLHEGEIACPENHHECPLPFFLFIKDNYFAVKIERGKATQHSPSFVYLHSFFFMPGGFKQTKNFFLFVFCTVYLLERRVYLFSSLPPATFS